MIDMEHCEVVQIKVNAKTGSAIGQCLREAILLAATEWKNVQLTHNQKVYKILPNSLLEAVIETSNKELYGNESPRPD